MRKDLISVVQLLHVQKVNDLDGCHFIKAKYHFIGLVPVQLLTSTTQSPTAVGHLDAYGCSIDNLFYSDGARVPSNPNNPCELCYCIRNKTACVMQECTLNIEGCRPVYQEGVCCPVRYDCGNKIIN